MDIREMLEKCKPFAPVVSAVVVAACVAGSLYGYKVPVYETKASVEDTQEQEDEVPVVKTSTEEETKEDEAAEALKISMDVICLSLIVTATVIFPRYPVPLP